MLPISPRQVVTLGILRDRLTIGRGIVALDDVEIMRLAEQSGVQEGELFAGRQLTRASVAREAGQMINPFPGPSHPVAGAHAASAFRALCAESSARRSGTLSVKKSCEYANIVSPSIADLFSPYVAAKRADSPPRSQRENSATISART